MRSLLAALAAATALVACGGVGAPRSIPSSTTPTGAAAVASPTQPINVDDMMGFYPQQTVFVADATGVSAVTLLNHFTRYTIPTRGKAQVAVEVSAGSGSWFYVLDGSETGPLRLRTFDIEMGVERASRSDIGIVASTQRAVAITNDGRVLVLKSDARHAWVDAYERLTLKPLGTVMEKPGCGDRLLATQARVAIVCLATGEIAVDALRGFGTTLVDGSMPRLAGAAMAQDGTIWAATADRQLAAVPAGAVSARRLAWPLAWSGTVLQDGIALATGEIGRAHV